MAAGTSRAASPGACRVIMVVTGGAVGGVGVAAVHLNGIVFALVYATVAGPMMSGPGVLRGLVFGGRAAFWIKDYIDTKFIRRFQAAEKN